LINSQKEFDYKWTLGFPQGGGESTPCPPCPPYSVGEGAPALDHT
jgi:hypothetical protein